MNKNKLAMFAAGILMLPNAYSGDVAQVHHMVTSIYFSPGIAYGQIALSVSGEGIEYQKDIDYGDTVSFSASDVGLPSLPDGHYSYSLTALPEFDWATWQVSLDNPALEQAFEAKEKANTHTQYGEFKVYLGQIKPVQQQSELQSDS